MEEKSNKHDLSKALYEIKNSNKNVSKVFIFEKGKIVVKDEYVTEEQANKTIQAFEEISERASLINGIKLITVQGANGRADITCVNDYFLTTIASKEATDETMNNLTHVFAPSILNNSEEIEQLIDVSSIKTASQSGFEQKRSVEIKTILSTEKKELCEPNLPTLEFSEFIVDNISGLDIISASSDVVRLDIITVGRWTELYGENKIRKVIIKEANTGKIIECKFHQIKESKNERRNTVLIPEVMQRVLKISKGSSVLIKPLIEQEPPQKPLGKAAIEQPDERTCKSGFLSDSYACQLIVEDPSRFSNLTANNVVRFDEALVERWEEFYGLQKIEEVIINNVFLGKSVCCKFKIFKDSKFEGKGLIQIPKSTRQELAVKEGSLVTIKPVVKQNIV